MAGKASSKTKKKTIELIKQDLLKKKQMLLAATNETISKQLGTQKENLPELGDQASMERDYDFLLRLKGREKKLLTKIEQALERIDKGTYGVCEDCEQDIGLKRLQARPVTTMCIECKTEQEEKEKMMK